MGFAGIRLSTELAALEACLKNTGLPVEKVSELPPDPNDFNIAPLILYVFAHRSPSKDMLAFMVAKAATNAPNFLAFCERPGSGVLSTEDTFGNITLLFSDSFYTQVQKKVLAALR